MDLTPNTLARIDLPDGYIELVEWQWPEIIDFVRSESELMLEMALPPLATEATVEFPELDPDNRCFVGTLFVRYPHITMHGRGEGGHIRVLRFLFAERLADQILGDDGVPPVHVLQGLLDIRSDSLRKLMGLALREVTTRDHHTIEALAALQTIVAVELRRVIGRPLHPTNGGRLAAWQFRKIREKLGQDGPAPTNLELAALCGISVRHLNRQFQALTGSTVADYVTNFQLERAKRMLLADDTPIKNIAFALGFAHPNSFARTFRRVTGMSPQHYRQRASVTA